MEFEKGDCLLMKVRPGKGKAKLRGQPADPEGNVYSDQYFRLWAGNGTALKQSNFSDLVEVEVFLPDAIPPRGRILDTNRSKKQVHNDWKHTLARRNGDIEYDSPLPELPDNAEIEEPDTTEAQSGDSSRMDEEEIEDEWNNRKSDTMDDLL